ncbi:MAG: hypothetical protein IJ315_09900 [Firmicutes bacterium]|nr:hypothetical protein [Bacillota bacterium]
MAQEKIPVRIVIKEKEYEKRLEELLRRQYKGRIIIDEGVRKKVVMLSDEPAPQEDPLWVWLNFGEGDEGINAYQSVGQLVRHIESVWTPSMGESAPHSYGSMVVQEEPPEYRTKERFDKLVCVFSPVGGCGKTTFSIAYCEAAARRNPSKKILYWNAEGAADWKLYFQNECPFNMSDLIYCMLMEGCDGLNEYLREIAVGQPNGVFFIKPCSSFQDLNVLGRLELYQLLKVLTDYFDIVVCDMNTAFENVNRQILKMFGHSFFLVNDVPGSRLKFQDFTDSLRQQQIEQDYMGERCTVLCVGSQTGEWKDMKVKMGEPLPWNTRMFRENNGRLELRQDSNYYERVRQLI